MKHLLSDPFEQAREESGVLDLQLGDEVIPLVLRFRDVRRVAKDWQAFSSDAPFRVPVPSQEDLRDVRQLPIETDPPEHTEYRAIVEPFFRRPTNADYMAQIEALVIRSIEALLASESVEVVQDFALPLQSRALALLLGVPLSHAEQFISWGTNVLHYDEEAAGSDSDKYDAYIAKQLQRAEVEGGADLFAALNDAEYRGRKLSQDEKMGFANLAFAGGRDTIINFVCAALVFLATHPRAFEQLRDDPSLVTSATEEFVRAFSPLTFIGRVCPHGSEIHGHKVNADGRVGICWMSANMDESVFKHPREVQLDRRPNPHVAFGSGVHTCLGAPQARLIMRTLLRELPLRVASMTVNDYQENWEDCIAYRRQNGFETLRMSFQAV